MFRCEFYTRKEKQRQAGRIWTPNVVLVVALHYQSLQIVSSHCSCRFHVSFSVVVVLYSYIVDTPLFKVWSEDKLNKKSFPQLL